MRKIHLHCVKLIFTLILAAVVSVGGESMSASSSKQEAASSTEKSFVELKKRADSGDADAQVNLGVLYANGQGVPIDYAQAIQWWDKGAAQGYPPAQINLGWLYYHIQDYVRARQWWKKAAAQGHAPAQFGLGVLYEKGQGVPIDYAQASQWWDKAAAQGYAPAQVNLGVLYRDGQGVPQDYATARRWYEKAAAQNNAIAQSNLGWVYATINGVPAEAQVRLGQLYANGQGVPQDYATARGWYEKAAAQGLAQAQYYLGSLYGIGQGVPKDTAKAVEWWQKAAAQGYAVTQYNLSLAYGDGRGVPEDSVLAYAWANLAAAQTYEGAEKLRDSITLSSAQRAEAERISSNWKQGQVLRRESESASAAGNMAPSGGALTKKGTGTAFVVSPEGHAITNHHVVASCKEVRVQGRSDLVQVITRDEISDLALLKMPGETRATAALAPDPASLRQGQDIVVFGFPLNSVLSSGGNLTPGVVSAITGLGNNSNQIQITAPIQPGSSGSPVMNKKGQVVGMVSMKLSDTAMAKLTGALPQNVSFAISGQTLKAFLDAHKVPYKTGSSFFASEKSLADLGDEAHKWTTVVECWK